MENIKIEYGIWIGYAVIEEGYWKISVEDVYGNSQIRGIIGSDVSYDVMYILVNTVTRSFHKGFELGFRNGQISRSKEIFALLNDSHEKDEQE